MTGLEDDEYEIPLRDQRYFGAGIKRKRVQFVPSSSTQSATTSLPAPASSTAARRYLEIVFGKRNDANSEPQASHAPREASRGTGDATGLDSRVERAREHTEASESTRSQSICDVCTRPIYDSATAILHQSSISHQICLQHSHGPSHVDRKRKGLQVLSTQGWDPDSRLGLGAEGEGILHPIKAKENPERAGLGVRPEDVAKARAKEKFANLDAGKVRKLEAEKKKRGQSLRDAFYRSEDVEKYLCERKHIIKALPQSCLEDAFVIKCISLFTIYVAVASWLPEFVALLPKFTRGHRAFMMWLLDHIPQLLATAALVTYATARNKLTPGGIAAGILVAGIHMLHPWPSFFWLLIVFFALGTGITKIGHAKKASLTQSSSGGTGGEGARTGAQVFANSGTACILILMHTYLLSSTPFTSSHLSISSGPYFPALQRLLPIGIVAQYAAVASDTFSSELGILATSTPFLITAPWKSVPRGTNGGVTALGLAYGALGSFLLVLTAALTLYVARPGFAMAPATATLLTLMGFLGSVIDSLLGALVQATVTDKKTGRVIEGAGGIRVQVGSVGKDGEGGSRVRTGRDLLTNNGVNFAMAAITSLLAMVVTHGTDIGLPRQ